MAGNFAKPFRQLPAGSNSPYSHPNHLSGCDVVARWQNTTLVRKAVFTNGVDSSGGFTYSTVAPVGRLDLGTDGGPYGGNVCLTSPPGFCGNEIQGGWIEQLVGDKNGLSTQEVQDMVDDIMACADADSTHAGYDHNCYLKSGSKDFRRCKKIGWKGVGAQKSWHGRPGFLSTDACGAAGDADQTRYLKELIEISMTESGTLDASFTDASHPGDPDYNFTETVSDDTSAAWSAQTGVNRYSGVKTLDSFSQNYTSTNTVVTKDLSGGVIGSQTKASPYLFDNESPFCLQPSDFFATSLEPNVSSWVSVDSTGCGISGIEYGTSPSAIEAAIAAINFEMDISIGPFVDAPGNPAQDITVNSVSVTDTVLEVDMTVTLGGTWSNTSGSLVESATRAATLTFHFKITLSNPYTAADCLADWKAAQLAWDMTDDTVYPWRGWIEATMTVDEELANLPMVIYDERPPVTPAFPGPTMNDYNTPISVMVSGVTLLPWTYDPNNYVPNTGTPPPTNWTASANPGYGDWPVTWAQITWQDPTNFVWLYGNGSYKQPPMDDTWPGATILSGRLTGDILSHNPAGYDRHFWFAAEVWERFQTPPEDSPPYTWVGKYNGGLSNSSLPDTTVRWQDQPFLAQADPFSVSGTPALGNLPQDWLRNFGGVLIGAKYVETRLTWPSVNFGRPYGKDRIAVDQTTVCATNGTNMRRVFRSIDPLATGGLQDGNYVMVGGDGVYKISAITANGMSSDWSARNQFTYALGSKVADIPAGTDIGGGYIGKMRWWSDSPSTAYCPPPFGLMACTAVFDGTNTTFTFPSTPYWTSISGAGVTCSVDLYLPDAVYGNPDASLASSVTITKTGDTTATVAGDYHTAKFLIPHTHFSGAQFLPEYDSDRPHGDFVRMAWTFNQRGASLATGSQPAWLGGTGAGTGTGLVGVTGITVTQKNIRFSPCCPAVVGAVVGTTLEKFSNQKLDELPATLSFDDRYGAYHQGATETTMVDPFWQQPFAPDAIANLTWLEDDGTGQADDGETIPPTKYYAHHPLVEALCSLPSDLGWDETHTPPALPPGVSLTFDTTANVIAPRFWPTGIPIAEGYTGPADGSFTSIERPFGFYLNVCSTILTNRFAAQYAYVAC